MCAPQANTRCPLCPRGRCTLRLSKDTLPLSWSGVGGWHQELGWGRWLAGKQRPVTALLASPASWAGTSGLSDPGPGGLGPTPQPLANTREPAQYRVPAPPCLFHSDPVLRKIQGQLRPGPCWPLAVSPDRRPFSELGGLSLPVRAPAPGQCDGPPSLCGVHRERLGTRGSQALEEGDSKLGVQRTRLCLYRDEAVGAGQKVFIMSPSRPM